MTYKLAKLQSVELRKVWKHEARDFTNWLSQEENIRLLGEEVGMQLTDVRVEEPIGRYNVDMVALEEDTQQRVIIENQLEYTDHRHLGQILTYAAGYDANHIIWIVKDVREEHQKAVEWLNDITSSELNFFLIRMELWQIGDSAIAPKFHIVSEPNDWVKEVKAGTSNATSSLTQTKILQKQFWESFKEYAQDRKTTLRLGRKSRPQHWLTISFGTSEAHLTLTVNTKEDVIACEVYIKRSVSLYQRLENNKAIIEEKLGYALVWMPLDHRAAFRIKKQQEGDISDENAWEVYFEWLLKSAEDFQRVFGEYI
jgi:hypothetical protein